MEGLIILILLLVLVAPLVLSVIALVKVGQLQSKVARLQRQLKASGQDADVPVQSAVESVPHLCKPPVEHKAVRSAEVLKPKPKLAKVSPVQSPKTGSPQTPLEWLMGARAAAFFGIAILVVGVSLLIAYAIQNAWMGPTMRCVLGVFSGTLLIGIGYASECRSANYRLLSRALTGGGGALFFVSVYAAYGLYHLIPALLAGGALLFCALVIGALAWLYRSQAVAVLGVVGAFLIPVVIRNTVQEGWFLLAYVALLNLPVIGLGLWRRWQWLYNLAFAGTAFYLFEWMEFSRGQPIVVGLLFSVFYFLEYAALGLLKLQKEQERAGRIWDQIRLMLASVLLLAAVFTLLDDSAFSIWTGLCFVGCAAMHVGLAWFGFRVFPNFTHEILSLLAGAILFAALALPVQLDGAWVSAGWALEGVLLAWIASRTRSAALRALGVLLGIIGILKGLAYDGSLYELTPEPFLNARFIIGILAAGLMGVQGWLAHRSEWKSSGSGYIGVAVLSGLAIAISDAFWTMGMDSIMAWGVVSWVMLIAGALLRKLGSGGNRLDWLGAVILAIVPLCVWFFGWGFAHEIRGAGAFMHAWIWIELGTVALALACWFLSNPHHAIEKTTAEARASSMPVSAGMGMVLLSMASGIALISAELLHSSERWGSMAMTLFWALSSVVLILTGLARQQIAVRYLGLALVVLCAGKVVMVDSTQLEGLARIGAYIGSGVLLLVLSFVYQRASNHFNASRKS